MALSKTQRLYDLRGKYIARVQQAPCDVKLLSTEYNRACIIIPKKYVSKATQRNRLKRTCLEIVAKAFKNYQIGAIIIRIYTKPTALETVPEVVSKCISQLRNKNAK